MLDISVIIPSYNDERILQTLESVKSQRYDHDRVRILVIDGGSDSELVEKIESELEPRDVLVSEPDQGIFDAINKGIALADGDLVFTIGSDDLFASRDAFRLFSKHMEESGADYAVCGTVYTKADLTPFRHWPATSPTRRNFLLGRQTCHFAFACRPSVYQKLGGFDLNYRTAADYDFFHRLAEDESLRGTRIPEYLVKMRQGGNSSKNVKNVLSGNGEIRQILVKRWGTFGQAVLPLKVYWKASEMARTRWLRIRDDSEPTDAVRGTSERTRVGPPLTQSDATSDPNAHLTE